MFNVGSVNGFMSEFGAEKAKPEETKSNELGQRAFLELMVAQLNNQDPLSPQDNTEFVAQLAQFSSVEGIDRLNTTTDTMAATFRSSQALQASAMVGRTVHVPGDQAILNEGGNITGIADLESSTHKLLVNIYDQMGKPVHSIDFGATAQGEVNFAWDGKDKDGNSLPPGVYRVEALASVDGKMAALPTAVSANVNSVTIGKNNDLTLNVAGVGKVSVSQVREIL